MINISSKAKKIKLGSNTAKGGFNNEKDVVEKFNSWEKSALAQQWLNEIMSQKSHHNQVISYEGISEITEVKARILSGHKTDVEVQITTHGNTKRSNKYTANLQVKLVSNKRGFNQIDKRWINKYKELWDFPPLVEELLKKFTGEIKPSGGTKNPKRMFLTEFCPPDREFLIEWFEKNRREVVSDILEGRGPHRAEWMLVIHKDESDSPWILKPMYEIVQKMGLDGDVKVSPRGSLYIGKITMQRKGGDGGRPSANMLQFKINPIDILD